MAVGPAERLVAADIVCLVILALLVFQGARIRTSKGAILYGAAILISFAIAFFGRLVGGGSVVTATVGLAALGMALLYSVVGYNIGTKGRALNWLVIGLTAGMTTELLIAIHDILFDPWFVDRMTGRVRGTFRSNGQLATYAFSVAGIVSVAAPRLARRGRLALLAGNLAAAGLLIIASSRRSILFAASVWALAFIIVGFKHLPDRRYRTTATIIGLVLFLGARDLLVGTSFLSRRIEDAGNALLDPNSFVLTQALSVVETASAWFPFGLGPGNSDIVGGVYEIHNAHLNLMVELGILGVVGFYIMLGQPVARSLRKRIHGLSSLNKIALGSFVLAASVAMFHNRVHRDRAFMLYVGVAAAVAGSTAGVDRRRKAGESQQEPIPSWEGTNRPASALERATR